MKKIREFIKSLDGELKAMGVMVLILSLVLVYRLAFCVDWNVPATSNFPIWSNQMSLQITSGSDRGRITIEGKCVTEKIIVEAPDLSGTPTLTLTLVNQASQSYWTCTTALAENAKSVVTVSEPIAGITSLYIIRSTASTTGETIPITLNVTKEGVSR